MKVATAGLRLHVGTYADAGGGGVYPLVCDHGDWRVGDPFRSAPNASFGIWSSRYGIHYFVNESVGEFGAYRHRRGKWELLAKASTQGEQPCFLALSPSEEWLAVANYGSGSIAMFALDPFGLPREPPTIRQNEGRGPNKQRQDGPHAHCVRFSSDGQWLYQTDLGTDEILAFGFDEQRGLSVNGRLAYGAPPGSGPRHLVFHPFKPLAFLISELGSTLTMFEVTPGGLAERQRIPTFPARTATENLAGHVAVNAAGNRLYATNRGYDSITTFGVDERGLSFLGDIPSGGASPRYFLLLEEHKLMIVTNEKGDTVTFFDVGAGGLLARSGGVQIPAPAFVFRQTMNNGSA